MELIYTVVGLRNNKKDIVKGEGLVCTLSTRNIIAFSSSSEPIVGEAYIDLKTKGNSYQKGFKSPAKENIQPKIEHDILDTDYKIFVCDIDTPWDIHLVTQLPHPVVQIHWDQTGSKLLLVKSIGGCEIWHMEECLLNDWQCEHRTDLSGEEVIVAAWLHSGNKCWLEADEKDSNQYTDKMAHSQFRPTVTSFGGSAGYGWVAITSSGQICINIKDNISGKYTMKKGALSEWRHTVTLADLIYDDNGDILLIASDGLVTSAIFCYSIKIKMDLLGQCTIECNSIGNFFVNAHEDGVFHENKDGRITHLKYLSLDSNDQILVSVTNKNRSFVELWSLQQKSVEVHHLFKDSNQDFNISENEWQHKSSISCNSYPVSIAVPRFPVKYAVSGEKTKMFQYIAIAYRDGSLKLINKHTFQAMTTTNLDTGIALTENVSLSEKRRRITPYIVYMQQALTGCCLVGIDQASCLYVMKAVNTRDPVTDMPLSFVVGMMEYLMINGYDWWDVMATIKPVMVDVIIQRLTENYNKQPRQIQEIYLYQMNMMKMSLHHCHPNSYHKVADAYCKLLCQNIIGIIESEYSPSTTVVGDMNPADKLSVTCSKQQEVDLNFVIHSMTQVRKDFVVDAAILQGLQPLIQWITDLILYLLTSIHMFAVNSVVPGSDIIRDPSLISKLREMLVVFRLWSYLSPTCLPHFTPVIDNVDFLAQLFKLITKVWLAIKDNTGAEFEETLVDECCQLQSQLMIMFCDKSLFGHCQNYQDSIFLQNHPVQYFFGKIPAYIAHRQTLIVPDGRIQTQQHRDIVRQIYLAEMSRKYVRQCCRCRSYSLRAVNKNGSNPLKNDYEKRWYRHCLCGGQWKAVSEN